MTQAASLRPADSPLKLYASAWSAPAWMKTNNALTGFAKLIPEYYQARGDSLMNNLIQTFKY